jgi:hypothetical protein
MEMSELLSKFLSKDEVESMKSNLSDIGRGEGFTENSIRDSFTDGIDTNLQAEIDAHMLLSQTPEKKP